MHIEVYDSFAALPEGYEALFAGARAQSLFLSRAWFQNLVDNALEENAKLRLYGVEAPDGDRPPLALLATRSPAGQNGSVLEGRRLGARSLAGLTNFQTSFFAPLVDASVEDPARVFAALAAALRAERPRWSLIDLNLLDPESPSFAGMMAALRAEGLVVRPYLYKGNWYERLAYESFEEYLADRERSERKAIQNYQRKRRKLQRAERYRFELITGSDRIEEAVAVYDRIHAASWKTDEFFPNFTTGLMRACAHEGYLRLGLVYVEDEPAAAEFAIVVEGKAIMMKVVYDQRFQRESVGSIAMLEVIGHLIDEDRIREIDFGTDDDPYKMTWVKERRERWGLVTFNPRTVAGALALSRHTAGLGMARAKQGLKPLLKPLADALRRRPPPAKS